MIYRCLECGGTDVVWTNQAALCKTCSAVTRRSGDWKMLSSCQHALESGSACPRCRSNEIESRSIEIEDGEAFQRMSCGACRLVWADFYKLKGYVLDR